MKWIVRRLVRFVLTFVSVITVTFVMIHQMPGGPAQYLRSELVAQGMDPAEIERRIQAYLTFEPDAPLWDQYVSYMKSILTGDLGQSVWYGRPVAEILAEALPWTVFIMGSGLLLMFAFGIGIGALMAYLENTRFDHVATVIFIVLTSTPYYIAAILLIFFLAHGQPLELFPDGTRYSPDVEPGYNPSFLLSVLHHAALPILSVMLTGMGAQALAMRGNSIQVLGTDYLRSSRIRGLSTRRIATRYVARNAVLPLYTGFMIAIGFMFGGAIILEEIFAYPGVGWYMLQAIQSRDYILLMGAFLVITLAVLIAVYIADLTYGLIDPRIGTNEGAAVRSSSTAGVPTLRFLKEWVLGLVGASSTTASRGATARRRERQQDLPERFQTSMDDDISRMEEYRETLDLTVLASLRVLWNDWRGRIGALIILVYVLMGTVGVALTDPPGMNEGAQMIGPFQTLEFPLGTDGFGQGLLTLVIHSTPAMLQMIVAGAVFATGVAVIIGTFAGYKGGTLIDRVLMFFTDTMMVIPGLPLVIVIAALFEPRSPWVVGIVLSINAWAGLARSIRSEVLSIREESYIEASNIMHIRTPAIVGKDILPNIMPYVTINFVNAARAIIFNSVGLYFLGVLPFSQPNWGIMLNFAYNRGGLHSWAVAHWIMVPMLTIILLSLGLILFAQAADQIFNPRIKARHAETQEASDSHAP